MKQGSNPYAEEWYAETPYWITMYTPLYPWLSSVLPMKDDNPFWTGRILTTIAVALAAALTLIAARGRVLIAALGAGAFLLVPPTTAGLAILRPDGLAVCLSALAVVALAGQVPRYRLAAVFTVVALLSKQSALGGPLACFAYLALRDRRLCARYVGWSLAIGGVGMIGLWATYGDGFWFSTLIAPRNPVATYLIWTRVSEMLQQPVFVATLVGASLLFVRSTRGIGSVSLRSSPFPTYAICSTLWIIAICGKLGSDAAYFVEPALAASLLLCDSAARALRRHQGRAWIAPVFALIAGAALFQVLAVTTMAHARTTPPETASRLDGLETARRALVGQMVGKSSFGRRPQVFNLYHPSLSYPLPLDVCVSDPLLYLILWSNGSLPTDSVCRQIEAQAFDYVILPTTIPPAFSRPDLAVLWASIIAAYQPAHLGSSMQVWIARGVEGR